MTKEKYKIKKIILLYLFISGILLLPFYSLLAQVMQGTTYKISSDSLNFGGDDVSTSTNYSLGDTLGELATGSSTSTNYALNAGFWSTAESTYITISSPSNLALSSIISRGISTEGTISWTVTTNNGAGYTMTVESSTNPALKSSTDYFANYSPTTSNPDYNFSVPATSSAFGFSPEGTDTHSRFKDNGTACNTGSSETSERCWDGFGSSAKTIATRSSTNNPSGTVVSLRLKAAVGTNYTISSGNYSASITATVTTL